MTRLTIAQRNQAIGMLVCGTSNRQVAKFFRVQTSTITRLWYRYQSTGTADDRQSAGRPKSLSDRHRRRIIRQHIANPTLAVAETGPSFKIHSSTVIRYLRRAGLRRRRPLRGPILLPHHRRNRLRWAREHALWTLEDWRPVLFSNECRFCLYSDDIPDDIPDDN